MDWTPRLHHMLATLQEEVEGILPVFDPMAVLEVTEFAYLFTRSSFVLLQVLHCA